MISAVFFCLFLSGFLGGGFVQCSKKTEENDECKPKELLHGKSDFLFKYLTLLDNRIGSQTFANGTSVDYPRLILGVFLETTCKKADKKNAESCAFNPKGKLAICKCLDVESCKYTGDKYEIDKGDPYQMFYIIASPVGREFENLYPDPKIMKFQGLQLESNVNREILPDGLKDIYKLKAQEIKFAGKDSYNYEKLQEALCDVVRTITIDLNKPGAEPKIIKEAKCPGFKPTKL